MQRFRRNFIQFTHKNVSKWISIWNPRRSPRSDSNICETTHMVTSKKCLAKTQFFVHFCSNVMIIFYSQKNPLQYWTRYSENIFFAEHLNKKAQSTTQYHILFHARIDFRFHEYQNQMGIASSWNSRFCKHTKICIVAQSMSKSRSFFSTV